MQHGIHRDRNGFGEFLVDLAEAVMPDYFLMDGIMGMEGPGPGSKGIPVSARVLLGSSNPLALDMIASRIAGYNPMLIPTNKTAFFRKKWLSSEADIIYDGPELSTLVLPDFMRIPVSRSSTAGLRFILGRTRLGRRLERRPVFLHDDCTGCRKCVDICPADAIIQHPENNKHIVLTDDKCIRCFCCAEACNDRAIDVRVRLFGA
jgi:ferredoxin